MKEIMIKVESVSKNYILGQIGRTTLRDELQRKRAKRKGLEDPTRKLGKIYKNDNESFFALKNISFEIKKGERVGVIGHNGAGKSTLLKLISRVTAPSSGVISMNGRVTSMLEIGTGFHPELTGRENIYMNGAILGMKEKEIDDKIEDIIEFSECREFIDTPVKRYSSGMYVKLAFSVAAHLDSEIMIMDEVLAVGDIDFQKKCIDKMKMMSENYGRTILYVSHNMDSIRQLCDRVIVLNKGNIIFDGDVNVGIDKYIGEIGISSKKTRLIDIPRRKNKLSGLVKIDSIEIIDYPNWSIPEGKKMQMILSVKAFSNLKNVGFRFKISALNGQAITSFSIANLFSCIRNENLSIPIEADTSLLVPGIYIMTPFLFGTNEYGYQIYDFILNALCFEIIVTPGNTNSISWSNNFGVVRMPELIDLRSK